MSPPLETRLDHVLQALPKTYPGPGGAVAIVRNGEALVRHAWGFANAERRIRFTPRTLFRMCSITKQFTCAVLLDRFGDPAALDEAIAARLPWLPTAPPTLRLCHNQSGLRDYWAVAMLQGAAAEAEFGDREARQVISAARSLQFAPGARYAYANQNFRLISDGLEDKTGRSFGELLTTHVFEPAGMADAFLAADTRAMPDGAEGYEGDQARGYRPAVNRVLWTGDAGLGTSLVDMIAWERHIDATRDDHTSLYHRLCAPAAFADGSSAAYGFGLARTVEFGRPATGHGGALRGWRSHRLHIPSERLSVVVLFNHLSDAQAAARDLLGAILGEARPPPSPKPVPPFIGAYLEPETGLAARIDPAESGVDLRFGHAAEYLELDSDGGASSAAVRLRPSVEGLWMERPRENQVSLLQPCVDGPPRPIAGRYLCRELDAELSLEDAGGALYGAFSGFLGAGRMEALTRVGRDIYMLPCPRALDHTPPGDWTLRALVEDDAVVGVQVGCWLARRLDYRRMS